MARNTLEIRLDLIQENYQRICQHIKPLEVMAVLKANAYGLGALPIAKALKERGCSRFGVADVNEGCELAILGVPIQLLGDLIDSEIPDVVEQGFIAPITSFEQATKLNDEARRQAKKVKAHFLVDTGMGRLGIPLYKAFEEIAKCRQFKNLIFEGIYSHFPHAYGDADFSRQQLESFKELLRKLSLSGFSFDKIHIANSDGIHNVGTSVEPPFSMVRTGINLLGYYDLEGKQEFPLNQVLSLKSKLIAVRTLPRGTTIGYGRTFRAEKEMRVGTVAIGYADGMPISLSNTGHLSIRGQACPIVGRVSMDYTTVDLTGVEATPGDEVLCLSDRLEVNDWARQAGTINYDIICSLGARVKRVYLTE